MGCRTARRQLAATLSLSMFKSTSTSIPPLAQIKHLYTTCRHLLHQLLTDCSPPQVDCTLSVRKSSTVLQTRPHTVQTLAVIIPRP